MKKLVRWLKNHYYDWQDTSNSKIAEWLRTYHYKKWEKKIKLYGGR